MTENKIYDEKTGERLPDITDDLVMKYIGEQSLARVELLDSISDVAEV